MDNNIIYLLVLISCVAVILQGLAIYLEYNQKEEMIDYMSSPQNIQITEQQAQAIATIVKDLIEKDSEKIDEIAKKLMDSLDKKKEKK